MHCGSDHYSYQDARRTAGNTNRRNGKIVRIHPEATVTLEGGRLLLIETPASLGA